MRCEDMDGLLFDVRTPDLVSTDAQVQAHLETCANCRTAVERAGRAWALLGALPEEEPDSRAMRARFQVSLQQRSRWRPSWPAPLVGVGMAASVVLALVTGAAIGRGLPAGEPIDPQDFNAMRRELRDVREMLTLSLLQQTVASERIKGASAAARMDDPSAAVVAAVLETLALDPSVSVRLACVRALERFNDRAVVRADVVRALVREDSPLVSMALIDFIVEAMDDTAVDALRQLSEDGQRDRAVRDTAARAVERLTTGGTPPRRSGRPGGTPPRRSGRPGDRI